MKVGTFLYYATWPIWKPLVWAVKKPFQRNGAVNWDGDVYKVEGDVTGVVKRSGQHGPSYVAVVKLKPEFTEKHGIITVEVPINNRLRKRPKLGWTDWFKLEEKYADRMKGGTIEAHIKDKQDGDSNTLVRAFGGAGQRFVLSQSEDFPHRYIRPGGSQRRMAGLMPAIGRGA